MWKSLCSCSPCKHSGNKHSVLATIFQMIVSAGREVCSWILILLFNFSRPFLPRPSGHSDLILSLEWFRNPNRSHAYLHLPGCSRPGSPQVPAAVTVPGSAALQCQSWISICPQGLSGAAWSRPSGCRAQCSRVHHLLQWFSESMSGESFALQLLERVCYLITSALLCPKIRKSSAGHS